MTSHTIIVALKGSNWIDSHTVIVTSHTIIVALKGSNWIGVGQRQFYDVLRSY